MYLLRPKWTRNTPFLSTLNTFISLTYFMLLFPFYTPWKHPKESDFLVFRGYRKRPLARNVLIKSELFGIWTFFVAIVFTLLSKWASLILCSISSKDKTDSCKRQFFTFQCSKPFVWAFIKHCLYFHWKWKDNLDTCDRSESVIRGSSCVKVLGNYCESLKSLKRVSQ